MRREDALKAHAALAEKAMGGLEFGPLREGSRQRAAGRNGKMGGDSHQTLGSTPVSQRGQAKLELRPLIGRMQGRAHKPNGEEPVRRARSNAHIPINHHSKT